MSLEFVSPSAGVDSGFQSDPCAPEDRNRQQSHSISAEPRELVVPIVEVLGLPLASMTPAQTLETIRQLIEKREPAFFITANLNYAMLCARNTELREVNRAASFLTADGMPLIWGARFKRVSLPGRVTGSDLTPRLCAMAAQLGYPVFILGAEPDVALAAGREMQSRFPGLTIAGIESPDLRLLSPHEETELVTQIRQSGARLVLVALGQPKGELWLARHYQSLGSAVCVQVGASIDFAAGHVRRAPVLMQRLGMEWLYRIYLEPRRLTWRYADNLFFLCHCAGKGLPGTIAVWWRSTIRRTEPK